MPIAFFIGAREIGINSPILVVYVAFNVAALNIKGLSHSLVIWRFLL